MWDPFWLEGGEQPCVVARQPFGRIAIANADAAAYAYTDAAIDEAYRAVNDCLVSRETYRSSNSMPELTVLDLGSDPLERGRVHGRTMRAEIRDNFATYIERFEAGGAKLPVVLEQSDAWAAFIARDNPEYAEEMSGVAAGADLSLTEIAMLNVALRIGILRVRFGSAVREHPRHDGTGRVHVIRPAAGNDGQRPYA